MLTICTHDGCFHADEVLACYLLKQLPVYKDAKIVRYVFIYLLFCYFFRTRDMSVIVKCDIVVDVGGIYDASKHRYDHHQR